LKSNLGVKSLGLAAITTVLSEIPSLGLTVDLGCGLLSLLVALFMHSKCYLSYAKIKALYGKIHLNFSCSPVGAIIQALVLFLERKASE